MTYQDYAGLSFLHDSMGSNDTSLFSGTGALHMLNLNPDQQPAQTQNAENTPKPKETWWDKNGKGFGKAYKAGFQAFSARNDALARKSKLSYQAQLASNQAAIAGYRAEIAQQLGAGREQDSRLETARQSGSQRARMAASGIDLGQGSATDVLASTAYIGERNAAMIRDKTNREVWKNRYEQAMSQYEQKARLAQMNAINPDREAFSSLMGSAMMFALS